MQINWTTILKCLIAIQMFAAVGCKKGESNKPSTRQTRIDNKAKQEQLAREKAAADEKAKKDAADAAKAADLAGGNEKPLGKGKLADGSYVVDDNDKKIDVSGKDCSVSTLVKAENGGVQLVFDNKRILIPVSKEVVDTNLKDAKALSAEKVEKPITIAAAKDKQYITTSVSSSGEQNAQITFTIGRKIIVFRNKEGNINQVDIAKALKEIPADEKLESALLYVDESKVAFDKKAVTSVTYNRKKYKNGSAPRDFVIALDKAIEGEFEKEDKAQLNCEIKK